MPSSTTSKSREERKSSREREKRARVRVWRWGERLERERDGNVAWRGNQNLNCDANVFIGRSPVTHVQNY